MKEKERKKEEKGTRQRRGNQAVLSDLRECVPGFPSGQWERVNQPPDRLTGGGLAPGRPEAEWCESQELRAVIGRGAEGFACSHFSEPRLGLIVARFSPRLVEGRANALVGLRLRMPRMDSFPMTRESRDCCLHLTFRLRLTFPCYYGCCRITCLNCPVYIAISITFTEYYTRDQLLSRLLNMQCQFHLGKACNS